MLWFNARQGHHWTRGRERLGARDARRLTLLVAQPPGFRGCMASIPARRSGAATTPGNVGAIR